LNEALPTFWTIFFEMDRVCPLMGPTWSEEKYALKITLKNRLFRSKEYTSSRILFKNPTFLYAKEPLRYKHYFCEVTKFLTPFDKRNIPKDKEEFCAHRSFYARFR
jgi:hypothetical protein